jgi:hypothetical protein
MRYARQMRRFGDRKRAPLPSFATDHDARRRTCLLVARAHPDDRYRVATSDSWSGALQLGSLETRSPLDPGASVDEQSNG